MASSSLIFRLYYYVNRKLFRRQHGFTLTELLIAIAISSVILSTLLTLVVEVLKNDRNEAVLNQTQQDTRRAVEYITRDLEEAVFVYPNQTDLETVTNQLSDKPSGLPVIGFWRVDPINPQSIASLNCSVGSSAFIEECNVVKLRQSMYTLVVYFLQDNNGAGIWEGPSRIARYELKQYKNTTTLAERNGYQDPLVSGFENWTADGNTDGTYAVLVDSIDDPIDTQPVEEAGDTFPQCDSSAGYNRVPDNSTNKVSYSFFTCVRDFSLAADEQNALETAVRLNDDEVARNNQDLVIYLRGDATEDRPGLFTTYNENSRLPTLETRILVRGILDKRPQ